MCGNRFVRSALAMAGAVLLLAILTPAPAQAQFGKLKDRAKAAATEGAAKKAAESVTGAAVETPEATPMAAETAGGGEANAAGGGAPASSANASAMAPGEGVWANYDFIPGENPLFIEDFSKDRVGNFPQRLEFIEGNMEVVEWEGRRFLRVTSLPAKFAIVLDEPLPEKYTLEFDIAPLRPGWLQQVYFTEDVGNPNRVICGVHSAGLYGDGNGKGRSIVTLDGSLDQKVFPCRVLVDGEYAKMYQGEHRLANVPNAALGHGRQVMFSLAGTVEQPIMIGNIRLMGGGRDLYDALEAEGRVTTQGIYFDSGSDRLRPESTPTLTEIGEMLKGHADLRLGIEGHTDADGDDAANQALSEKRAAAVKAYLVESYGIEEGRLETMGFGESKPVADNATPEGRQENRRVELVKLD